MTPDLLRRFATNPKLALGLQNPRFVKAMEELQRLERMRKEGFKS